jgi:y4mF family transcriptional regulator
MEKGGRQLATMLMRIRDPIELGRIIHRRRRTMGWSQERLAKAAGVGRQWVLELEKGKKGPPLDLVIHVLDALGYTLDVGSDVAAGAPIGAEIASFRPEAHPVAKGGYTNRRTEREVRSQLPAPVDPEWGPSERLDNTTERSPGDYKIASFETIGIAIIPDQLFKVEYRALLSRMVAHVIAVEAPMFEDVLARRIARVHGRARATRKLIEFIQKMTEAGFPRTQEDDRTIVWPEHAEICELVPFRRAPLDIRDHPDIPLIELAALAGPPLEGGHTPEAAAIIMGRELGLGRILPKTRSRLIMAAELAKRTGLPLERGVR